jgi:GWxTD domain-containing protein
MKKTAIILALLAVGLCSACAAGRLEKSLDPDSRDFLSKVRYLVTKQERRIFLTLPPSEREKFIEEFWLKRDPDPDTEENEFKTQYFERIEEANRLFHGGGSPGWLQDRGRVYILLGPPTDRQAYPRGVTFYGAPTEVWYYGFFEIIFIDQAWNGDYKLDPSSPQQLAIIMSTQLDWKPKVAVEKGALDFALAAEKTGPGQAVVRARVPYNKIWLKSEEKTLRTTLSLEIEILNSSGGKAGELKKDFPLELTEERLEKIITRDFVLEVPLTLPPGSYTLNLTLTNLADNSKVRRTVKLAV